MATIGDVDAALAKISVGDRLIPVRVQLKGDVQNDINRIAALRLTTATGVSVPLSAVALPGSTSSNVTPWSSASDNLCVTFQ